MKQGNSNSDEIVPINFQPIPKRFKVWSMRLGQFLTSAEAHRFLVAKFMKEEPTNVLEFTNTDKHIIIQSTNLFDKDGKEIFEGSIIHTLIAKWVVKQDKGCMCAFNYHTGVVMPLYKIDMGATKVVGHILSNPELLEEK